LGERERVRAGLRAEMLVVFPSSYLGVKRKKIERGAQREKKGPKPTTRLQERLRLEEE